MIVKQLRATSPQFKVSVIEKTYSPTKHSSNYPRISKVEFPQNEVSDGPVFYKNQQKKFSKYQSQVLPTAIKDENIVRLKQEPYHSPKPHFLRPHSSNQMSHSLFTPRRRSKESSPLNETVPDNPGIDLNEINYIHAFNNMMSNKDDLESQNLYRKIYLKKNNKTFSPQVQITSSEKHISSNKIKKTEKNQMRQDPQPVVNQDLNFELQEVFSQEIEESKSSSDSNEKPIRYDSIQNLDLYRDDDHKKDVPFAPFFDVGDPQKRTKSQVFFRDTLGTAPSFPQALSQHKEQESKSEDRITVKSHIAGTVISVQDVIKAQDYIKSHFGYDINDQLQDVILEDEKKEDPKGQEIQFASLKLNRSIDQQNQDIVLQKESKTTFKAALLNNDLMISSESDSVSELLQETNQQVQTQTQSQSIEGTKVKSKLPVLSHLKRKDSTRVFDNNAFIDSFGLVSDEGLDNTQKSANFNVDLNSPSSIIAKKAYKKQKLFKQANVHQVLQAYIGSNLSKRKLNLNKKEQVPLGLTPKNKVMNYAQMASQRSIKLAQSDKQTLSKYSSNAKNQSQKEIVTQRKIRPSPVRLASIPLMLRQQKQIQSKKPVLKIQFEAKDMLKNEKKFRSIKSPRVDKQEPLMSPRRLKPAVPTQKSLQVLKNKAIGNLKSQKKKEVLQAQKIPVVQAKLSILKFTDRTNGASITNTKRQPTRKKPQPQSNNFKKRQQSQDYAENGWQGQGSR